MLEGLPQSDPKSLSNMFPLATPEALDVLRLMLHFNPSKRITAEKALEHPYVAQFHNAAEEPVCEKELRISIDDDHKYSISEYRNQLYMDIIAKRKEKRRASKDGSKHKSSSKTKSKSKDGSKTTKSKTSSKEGKKHTSSDKKKKSDKTE
jgi:mitogen-activated protein kinase 15